MIKVITFDSNAWDIGVFANSESSKPENERHYVYESSVLKEFLEDGWEIVDWKYGQSGSVFRQWTFILEKEDE